MPVEDIFAEPGTSAETPVPSRTVLVTPPPVPPAPPLPPEDQSALEEKPRKRGILWVLVGIVILSIGLGVFLAWRYMWFTPAVNTGTLTPVDLNLLPEEEVIEPIDNSTIVNQAPSSPDQDRDGLTQEEETTFGTSDLDPDSDDDGLNDKEEVKIYKTDPNKPDTDRDGYLDGEEVKNLYNPNGPGKLFSLENIQI